MVKVVGR